MKIFVCVKHVPDSAATIVVRDGNKIDEKITFLLNPYDEYAVTEAVRFKKYLDQVSSGDLDQVTSGGETGHTKAEVIAVCLGMASAEKTVRSAMEMGADRGILIKTESCHPDSITTAKALKAAIAQDGNPDIIFTGRESIDMSGAQTMFRLGACFNFQVVNNVVKFTPDITDSNTLDSNEQKHIDNNANPNIKETRKVRVETLTEGGGRDIYELSLPCILGAGRGLNTPIYPTFPDFIIE
ncbi:MAG: hypothetical protein HQK62_07645, partial [Desulfamplus sp.]|nr:hypothetical protein [Desulfamplus sp.]